MDAQGAIDHRRKSLAGRPGRRAEGTRRIYRLNPDGVTALRAYLDRVWEEALTAFAKATQATPVDPEQEDQ
jgi:hypothetical protein